MFLSFSDRHGNSVSRQAVRRHTGPCREALTLSGAMFLETTRKCGACIFWEAEQGRTTGYQWGIPAHAGIVAHLFSPCQKPYP